MRGAVSIRTETHLRRFLHGIRLFCNAHSPPKALSPQKLFLSQKHDPIFQSTLLPLAIRSAAPAMCSGYALARIRLRNSPYCRWQYGPSIALFRYAQYGLLSPYFAALNTGSCYAIAPTRGAIRSAAPAMCSGYALARIRLRNPPYCPWQYGLK